MRVFFIFVLCLVIAIDIQAVPAKPGPIEIIQSDGSSLYVLLHGDEYIHFQTTLDGFMLLPDTKGDLFYADVDKDLQLFRTAVKAREIGTRSSQEKSFVQSLDKNIQKQVYEQEIKKQQALLRNSTDDPLLRAGFPLQGKVRSLIILVEFQDVSFTVTQPQLAFSNLMNLPGYSSGGATGSCKDYFEENSSGSFKPEFDVYGPVKLSKGVSYYDDGDGSPAEMVKEACESLNAQIDFSLYDEDNDGWVDNVFVFYAGHNEAEGAPNTIWPHQYNITYMGLSSTLDGVRIGKYACTSELKGASGNTMCGIGTFCHEFSHVLGLPDLYSTNYSDAYTPGVWSLLDVGPYNNSGRTPPYMTAYERSALGWLKLTELTAPSINNLKDISQNEAYIIKTSRANEYFLLENRQQKGWDTYVPGHGMLIWHIDYNASRWSSNTVNNTVDHQYVDIEEANAGLGFRDRKGEPFPGITGKTEFTDLTTPNMKMWNGASLNKPVTAITENSGLISFRFMGGAPIIGKPQALDAENIGQTSFTARWEKLDDLVSYQLDVYRIEEQNPGGNTVEYLDGYCNKNVGTGQSYVVTGLEPATTYYYVVRATNGYDTTDSSNEISASTLDPTFDYFAPKALNVLAVTDHSFLARWEEMPDANTYFLDVYSMSEKKSLYSDYLDFTGKVAGLPKTWKTTCTGTSSQVGMYGASAPSLAFNVSDLYLMSPVYDEDISMLSFWYKGVNTLEENTFVVEISADGKNWSVLETIIPFDDPDGQIFHEIFPDGVRSVRFTFYRNTTAGALVLDDVNVGFGVTLDKNPLSDYTDKPVGNVLSYHVVNLEPETEYRYVVRGFDGSLTSKSSNEIQIVTLPSSVSGILSPSVALGYTVSGNTLFFSSDSIQKENIGVYTILGQTVYAGKIPASGIRLNTGQVYIVKKGDKIFKIVL